MAKGVSLHIGLNEVDPKVYGDSYKLNGCINDAYAMADIAKKQGYSNIKMLLDKEATGINVVNEIKKTALELEEDDIFFITYSGHGSSVDDVDGDESDGKDETWCLYDGMLLDDNLYKLWFDFKENVRIILLSDSCHSGTITKEIYYNLPRHGNRNSKNAYKFIDNTIAQKIYNNNKRIYNHLIPNRDIGIKCSVKSISGCQDNQLSRDGDGNGLFTANLLKVWNNGDFKGSYRKLHKEILKLMPPDQTPNYSSIGKKNAGFDREKPFSI